MALRHRVNAALLQYYGIKLAEETPTHEPAPPLREDTLPGSERHEDANKVERNVNELAHNLQRLISRAGGSRTSGAPLTQLPEADPAIMDNVLQRARTARDPADYLRLLSHDPAVNELARMSALPTLLLTDALTGRSRGDAKTRESVIDVLRNLQVPSMTPARLPEGPKYQGALPLSQRAYPLWYQR